MGFCGPIVKQSGSLSTGYPRHMFLFDQNGISAACFCGFIVNGFKFGSLPLYCNKTTFFSNNGDVLSLFSAFCL